MLLFSSLAFLADYKPSYGSSLCWFNNKKGLAVFFALPLGAVILENFVLFLFTVYGIHTQLRASRSSLMGNDLFLLCTIKSIVKASFGLKWSE